MGVAEQGGKIRYAAILDTETTGLSPAEGAVCIEIAIMLYDVKLAQPVASYASLIRRDGNEAYGMPANGAEHINGIPGDLLANAPEADVVWRCVKWLIAPADVVIAHRADFDKKFVPDLSRPWICSKSDIKWPGNMRGDHLVQLALNLGLGVASAHRAATDVDTLARILTRVAERGHDLEQLLLHASRPKVLYYAQVSYEDRRLASQHGFLWDPPTHGKNWYRYMPPEDVKELPFPVKTVPA
jgi:DNA polymerase III epsilon subunit-like protein